MLVVVLKLGWGNVDSLYQFFIKLGFNVKISKIDEIDQLNLKEYICVIPGIGSAQSFSELNVAKRQDLVRFFEHAKLTIGICLGAHFLATRSEEYDACGLNIIKLNVKKIADNLEIGYRTLNVLGNSYSIYHCHNYYMPIVKGSYLIGELSQGSPYSQIIIEKNFCLIQGHPEKSGKDGEKLIKSIVNYLCI